MLRTVITVASTLVLAAAAHSATLTESMDNRTGLNDGFFSRHAEGWFWYQDPQQEEMIPLPLPEAVPRTPDPAEFDDSPKPFTLAWVKGALNKYMEAAWDNPTPENVKAYFLLQRFVVDRANKFADVAQQVMVGNALLDETLRRPLGNFATYEVDKQSYENSTKVLQKIAKSAGLFFFFKSSCPYCEMQAPIIKHIEKIGFKVIAVSIDGGALQSVKFDDTRKDSGQAQMLKVKSTPTIFLMDENGKFETLAISAVSLPELRERILLAAFRAGIITEAEFKTTQPLTAQPDDTDMSKRLPELIQAATDNPASLWGGGNESKKMDELAKSDYSYLLDERGVIPPATLLALLGDDAGTSHKLTNPAKEKVEARTNRMTVFTEN